MEVAYKLYNTLENPLVCKRCKQYSRVFVDDILVPYCSRKWLGGKCEGIENE